MKQKLKDKLRSEGQNMSWFWAKHIRTSCKIGYFTFQNQLDERSEIKPETKLIIEKYLSGDK